MRKDEQSSISNFVSTWLLGMWSPKDSSTSCKTYELMHQMNRPRLHSTFYKHPWNISNNAYGIDGMPLLSAH